MPCWKVRRAVAVAAVASIVIGKGHCSWQVAACDLALVSADIEALPAQADHRDLIAVDLNIPSCRETLAVRCQERALLVHHNYSRTFVVQLSRILAASVVAPVAHYQWRGSLWIPPSDWVIFHGGSLVLNWSWDVFDQQVEDCRTRC